MCSVIVESPAEGLAIGQIRALRTASVLGLGHALPETTVSNEPIAARIGVDAEWIERRTGVRNRHVASADDRVRDLAVLAGKRALADAGVSAESIDLVLVATLASDALTPSAAPLVAHDLEMGGAAAFDIGGACAGWLGAMSMACAQIEAHRFDRALVIGAEILTRFVNHDDKRTAALFGDAAGAVVLGANGAGSVGPIVLTSDGTLAGAIRCERDTQLIEMDGHETFKFAVKVLADSTEQACERAGCTLDDIDLFVYHQANGRILTAVGERLELPAAKVADYIGEIGNTSAASIPLTLSLARADGRIKPGARVLVSAVGAGFVWGAGVIEWGNA